MSDQDIQMRCALHYYEHAKNAAKKSGNRERAVECEFIYWRLRELQGKRKAETETLAVLKALGGKPEMRKELVTFSDMLMDMAHAPFADRMPYGDDFPDTPMHATALRLSNLLSKTGWEEGAIPGNYFFSFSGWYFYIEPFSQEENDPASVRYSLTSDWEDPNCAPREMPVDSVEAGKREAIEYVRDMADELSFLTKEKNEEAPEIEWETYDEGSKTIRHASAVYFELYVYKEHDGQVSVTVDWNGGGPEYSFLNFSDCGVEVWSFLREVAEALYPYRSRGEAV